METWRHAVTAAAWGSLRDVRQLYRAADGVKLKSGAVVTVFDVSPNAYRLLAVIDYKLQLVAVLDVLTHDEYDRENWKRKY
jgi:mRNA interferase HigB